MELTSRLAEHLVKTNYEALPLDVVKKTKMQILDMLGVMIPPSTLEKSCKLLEEIAKEAGEGREHNHRVWGKGTLLDGGLCEWLSLSSDGL